MRVNHWAPQSQVLLAAIPILFCCDLWAQDAYLAHWQELRAKQPQAVTFEITAAKSQFYLGELIPLQLSFTSTQPNGFRANSRMQDRVGRMNGIEEFLVDPVALTEDPLRGLPGEGGGMGGLSGGPIVLSAKQCTFEKLLNEWIRFRKPGKYRVAIASHRVVQIADPAKAEQISVLGAQVELVSNILTLDIIPAPTDWMKQQIAAAVKILDAPVDPNGEARERRLKAGQTLRFLDSPEAAIELAKRLGSGDDLDSWSLHMGVLGSPYRKQLLPVIEARLIAPDQPVWDRYLDTLSHLSELVASGGPVDSFPKNPAFQSGWQEEAHRRAELGANKRKEYTARLIASLPSKQPEARVISMNTLIDSAGRDGRTDTAWLPTMAASIVADFRSLSSRTQINLLAARWNIIGSPAMLPLLREIYAHPSEQAARDIAVRRIFDLAPEEGRRIILSQIARPYSELSISTLVTLPDRSLPELNDELASRVEASQSADMLILRYATGDIVGQVEQAYLKRNAEFDRQKLLHCGGPLIFYFLKYDPAFGERELRKDIVQPSAPPACYDIGFQFSSLDGNAYSPALERLAIEFLASPAVPVKRGAAEVLGKYGSPAAEKPLWDTLEYFHSWWKGHEEQLKEPLGQEGLLLERALRIALAQANGWTLREDGLNRILDLCSSGWCKQDVGDWLPVASQPVAIRLVSGSDEFHASIAQYDYQSEEQMRRKIRQFPAGTVFRIAPFAQGDSRFRAAVDKAEQIVRSEGYSLATQ